MGYLYWKILGGGDLNESRNKGFKHNIHLSWMMMGVGIKVSIGMGFILIDLVREGGIT